MKRSLPILSFKFIKMKYLMNFLFFSPLFFALNHRRMHRYRIFAFYREKTIREGTIFPEAEDQ